MLFVEEEAELLPKKIAKTQKISVDHTWNIVSMTDTYHREGHCKRKEKKTWLNSLRPWYAQIPSPVEL